MIRVLKALIDSLDLGIYSYVKPGAPHRFSTHFLDLHSYVRTITESLDTYVKAIKLGEDVGEGRLGLDRVSIGGLISDALKASAKVLSFKNIPEVHLVLVPVVLVSSYSLKIESSKDGFLRRFSSGLKDILLYTGPQEVIKVYEGLRSYGGRYTEVIDYISITKGKILSERLSLIDFYSELGSKDFMLKFFSSKYDKLPTYARRFVETYVNSGDYNLAAINTYSHILNEAVNMNLNLVMKSRSDLLRLLKLDKELISEGKNYSTLIPVLISSILIGELILSYH